MSSESLAQGCGEANRHDREPLVEVGAEAPCLDQRAPESRLRGRQQPEVHLDATRSRPAG